MALIKCPECGKEISDQAANCPNCGFPMNNVKGWPTAVPQLSDEDIEKRKRTKIAVGLIATGIIIVAVVFLIPALREETLTAQEMAVKVGYNAVKKNLLNPDSMIVYSCYAHGTQSEQLMSENRANNPDIKSGYVDNFDLINVYLYIGAQNKSGGITDEEYIITCDLEGELLDLSAKSEYDASDISERSHQTSGSWLEVAYAKLVTPAWKDWQEYSGEDLEDIINSKATTIREEVKSSETTQLSESERSEDVLNMEDLANDLKETCNDYLYDSAKHFNKNYSIPNVTEYIYLSDYGDTNVNVITIVLCNNESELEQAVVSFKDNIETDISIYNNHPLRVEKLENAIIKTKGLYAVLCICDDYSKANTILQEYGFN